MSKAGSDTQVAVLLYPGCIVAEVAELANRLEFQGVQVHWVTPDGTPVTDQSGLGLAPTNSIAGLQVDELDGLVIPGGGPESILGDASVRSFVRRCRPTGS